MNSPPIHSIAVAKPARVDYGEEHDRLVPTDIVSINSETMDWIISCQMLG
jgi:hypothetical protein